MSRPHVILSFAMSLDGYIDDASAKRRVLSSDQDFAAVYALRATCDAVIVGAGTIRKDDPRLITLDDELAQKRLDAGKPADPTKVTVTASGELNPDAKFFQWGDGEKVVYCNKTAATSLAQTVGDRAAVRALDELTLTSILCDLSANGHRRVMVEGGQHVITAAITEQVVDQIRLAIAPIIIGDESAPRFVTGPVAEPFGHRFQLVKCEDVGGTAVLTLERKP